MIGYSKSKQEFPCVNVSIEPCGCNHFLLNHKLQKKTPCLFCYFQVQICANSGLPVLLEAVSLFKEMSKNGLWPLSVTFNLRNMCLKYLTKVFLAWKDPEYAIFDLSSALFLQLIKQLRKAKHSGYLAQPFSLI